jgi:hypothetical protein
MSRLKRGAVVIAAVIAAVALGAAAVVSAASSSAVVTVPTQQQALNDMTEVSAWVSARNNTTANRNAVSTLTNAINTHPDPTTTTSTSPPTTTPSTTTSSMVPTTTPATTTPTTAPSNAPACGLVAAVFCETFDAPAGNGGRSGDLNPELWGVSRLGRNNGGGGEINTVAATGLVGCGTVTQVIDPNDVRVCGGRLTESVNDAGSVTSLAAYPKQPFDFAGRTGKVAFDVTDDTEGSHAAWPEFWITQKPYPDNFSEIGFQVPPIGENSIGFQFAGSMCPAGQVGLDKMNLSQSYVFTEPAFTVDGCVAKSAGVGQPMNHFEVDISTTGAVVYGTNPGSSTLVQLAHMTFAQPLNFSRGLVWLTDTHYNAKKSLEPCECGTQVEHTFQWDNLGFDGPKTYRDLSFDVHDAHQPHAQLCDTNGQGVTKCWNAENEGYQMPVTLSTDPVFRRQTPTGAIVTFNSYSWGAVLPSVSLNGGPAIANPWPYKPSAGFNDGDGGFSVRSYWMTVPLDQVHDGVNTLTFTTTGGSAWVANVNLILVAGAPVP